ALVSRVGQIGESAKEIHFPEIVPVARTTSVAELGIPCALPRGPPRSANVISLRNAFPLYGLGLIEYIADDVILANAKLQVSSKGRPNWVKDDNGRERIGRYGWKADVAGLEEFVALAFRNEMGITSPLAPLDIAHDNSCGKARSGPDDDGSVIGAVTAYLLALPAPSRAGASASEPVAPGRHLFSSVGCVMCHTPVLES